MEVDKRNEAVKRLSDRERERVIIVENVLLLNFNTYTTLLSIFFPPFIEMMRGKN